MCNGTGSTTGMLSILSVAAGAPSSTVTGPLAGMTWTCPACSVPSQSVEPVSTVIACTQHGPDVARVTL